MWKKLRLPLLVFAAVSLAALLFSWQLKFLYVPVRVGLEKLTGQPVTFSTIDYRLFNRVTIRDLTVGSTLRAKTITVYFNPLQLLTTLAAPQYALFRVHLSAPSITVSPELTRIIEHLQNSSPEMERTSNKNDLKISWEDALIISGGQHIDRLSGQTIIGRDISGRMTGKYQEEQISLVFDVQSQKEGERARAEVKMNGPRSAVDLIVNGTRNASGTITATIDAPKLSWDKYSLKETSGTVLYSDKNIAATVTSNAVDFVIKGSDPAHLSLLGDIRLDTLIPGTSGTIHASAASTGEAISGTAAAVGLMFKGQLLGDITLAYKNDAAHNWNISGTVAPSDCSFNASLKEGNNLEVSLISAKKETGKITGTLSPLRLSVNVEQWPAGHLPVISNRFPGVQGDLSVNGVLSGDSGDITVTAKKWLLPGAVPVTAAFHLIGKDRNWFLKAETEEKDLRLSVKYLKSGVWDASAEFHNSALEQLLPWASLGVTAKGRLTGAIAYSSSREGTVSLEARRLRLNGMQFDEAKAAAVIDKEAIKVNELAVHSGNGTVTAFAKIGLDESINNSKASIRFCRFPVDGRMLHGAIEIKGTLTKQNGLHFGGTCQTGKIQFDRWAAQRIRSSLTMADGRIDLKGLQIDSILKGDLSLQKGLRIIDCTFQLHRLPLSMLLPALQGHVSGNAVIKGSLADPDAVLNITSSDARYNGASFTVGGKFVHKNNEFYCSDLALTSGSGKLTASGRLLPKLAVTVSAHNFSPTAIEQALKTSLPVHGLFSGSAGVTGTFGDPRVAAELSGKSVSLDSLPLSECKTSFTATKDAVALSFMSLKFSDSELKLQPESIIDLKKKTYTLHTEWRNVHAGPVDLFGVLLLKGGWNKNRNGTAFNGIITTGNFWLNQHVLDKAVIAVSFRDHILTFIPQNDQQLKIEGAIDLQSWPELAFRQWQIKQGNRSLALQGVLGEKRWDFTASGRLLHCETLSELLNLPFNIEGDMDLNIIGKGSVDHPQIEGSVSAANGAIANVPFDSVNLQVGAHQDVMTITSARLVKKNQYTVIATGYTPFFLDEAGEKRVQHRPLDLVVTVEEGTLNLLKGISSDILSASGGLRVQTRLTGTLAKPVGNGFLRISNGVVNSKRYFSKLSGLNVELLWKDNLLTIKDFSGRIGDGRVRMKGGLVLQGLSLKTVNVAFFTDGSKGVPIFVPELPIPSPLIKSDEWKIFSNSSHGEPRFNVQLSGPANNLLLSGWVELENTHFSYPPPTTTEAAESETPLDALWPRISWALELRSGKNTWYDNDLVNVSILGGIRLGGKGEYPSVDGKVESVRGTITYIGREFTIKQAMLEINHDTVFVEGEAETDVNGKNSSDSDVIKMYIDKSKIENLKPRFVSKSDPDMTPEKAMAKATGVDPEAYSNVDQAFIMRQQLIRLIDSTLATPLARNLLSRSGIADSFRVKYLNQEPIKPAIPGSPTLTELLYGTKYSVEKHLTNQILFGYSVTFDQAQNRLDLRHELELSYRLQKNTFLTGSYELESKYNTLRQPDRRITVEQQWRFGWTPKKKH